MLFPFEWLIDILLVALRNLQLEFRRRKSRGWPTTSGAVQRCSVIQGYWPWDPNSYRSVLGYAFRANQSRYAGFFALKAENEEMAQMLQKRAEGITVTVRFNPQDPDVSLLEDKQILGREVTQNAHWLL